NPLAVLISKMTFNALLTMVISILAFVVFSLFLGYPDWDVARYGTLVLLFAIGIGLLFTALSAIASKTKSGGILMPLLSFPLVIPMIVVGVAGGATIVMGNPVNFIQTAGILLLIDLMIGLLASIVFRFLWQD
ncbi:MAG: heme exporter protein CcmB, partial [Bacteroidia bacterium]|nr:heme exporter protein CcmB [Bacteroidia bacterium]